MKTFLFTILAFLCISQFNIYAVQTELPESQTNNSSGIPNQDKVTELINLLNNLDQNSDNTFFKMHCQSIIKVISAKSITSPYELPFIDSLYKAFSDTSVRWSPAKLSSYLDRKRTFIVSWTSPTDGDVSLAWLVTPENWEPEKAYPLYVRLHGLYLPYEDPIEYMARYISPHLIIEPTFEDGYSFYPWGRGNIWYEGIGEIDIWESVDTIEKLLKIDPARKYLTGHSMGGYGAWAIGQKSPEVWAALGIYAGALWYNNGVYLNYSAAERLKDVPVYIVCGDQDGLLGNNQAAYNYLLDAGNQNVRFTTFHGGHESLLSNWQEMYVWIKDWNRDSLTLVNTDEPETQYNLYNNYPNPFNPETVISYSLPFSSKVDLDVFDMLGRKVTSLVNKNQNAGRYEIKFNTNEMLNKLSSGIYFYRLTAIPLGKGTPGTFIKTNKMVIAK